MEIYVKRADKFEDIIKAQNFCAFCGYHIEKVEAIPTVDGSEWLFVFHGFYPSVLRCTDGRWVEDVWERDVHRVLDFLGGATNTLPNGWHLYIGDGVFAEYWPVRGGAKGVVPFVGLVNGTLTTGVRYE